MVCVSRACVERECGAGQQLRHADDAIHRRAQLVAHALEEVALRLRRFGQLPVALDQLARAQRDLRLQSLLRLDDAAGSLRGAPALRWTMSKSDASA